MAQHDSLSTSGGLGLARLEGRLAESFFAPHTPTYGSKFQLDVSPVHSTSPVSQPSNLKPATTCALKHKGFLAIAARAFQESVKLPDGPPPAVWAPHNKMHSYYEWLLYRFGAELQSNLRRQGVFDYLTFRNEWLRHGRSITDNIRAEWGLHPLGSTAAVKTTLETEYTEAAVRAVEATVKFPTMPPPEGWRLGDGLHPYYDTMLRRFHNHMCDMLEQWGAGLFQRRAEASDAVGSYKEYIIREYRKTWIQMFGIPDLKVSVDVQPSSVN
ncbi:uncharacterized protein CIMG_07463 [Coccidioides immitis RS]|uniref:Uncharacterized protein n=3 Tax=Coccidioides immitis TaxID=5501 RepID=J3K3F8_COCIM|nr:uncharacterized protein CIMG_07463 [Coccidioides immitis RS]EAS28717.3 hypothetical protein CIMG_07463 [Coccidioides immitis RS]KMP05824.1 hypothetical protein CIRG_05505 [Coccidioides immitis RMSCC 2394]KMU81546.1 hypothetical protein CISG_09108 [Coccidioides immitis RMSCC 3703]TPX23092.1 hypothetical protein DIZ76_014974 [Coccidioides immitis]